jgi:hypothetical protein
MRLILWPLREGGEHVTAHRKKMLSRTYSARMLAVLLRVHQTALRAQVNALINKFGMPVKLNAVVRRLWLGYLGAW